MNPIARQALAKALQSPVPARPPVARTKPAQRPTQQPAPVEKKTLAIAGKPERPKNYDHVGFLEGKRDATDMVTSMTGTLRMPNGLQQVIKLLKSAATGRPASQALGIWSIIELLEAA